VRNDRSELGDEVEPVLRVQVEGVSGDDAERQLQQRNRHAQLDRDDARNEDDGGESCGELDWAHGGLLGVGDDVR